MKIFNKGTKQVLSTAQTCNNIKGNNTDNQPGNAGVHCINIRQIVTLISSLFIIFFTYCEVHSPQSYTFSSIFTTVERSIALFGHRRSGRQTNKEQKYKVCVNNNSSYLEDVGRDTRHVELCLSMNMSWQECLWSIDLMQS